VSQDIFALRVGKDMPISMLARQTVNAYFEHALPAPSFDGEITLYIASERVRGAKDIVAVMKEQAGFSNSHCRLLVVAPDTASPVTRPPTDLLAASIGEVLRRESHLIVAILPSYTDADASARVARVLSQDFAERVMLMPHNEQATLLNMAAFIDQADVFLTGDTGVMHLAVATKKLAESEASVTAIPSNNAVKIIALFGGTNPAFHGYSMRTVILGKGRKEQASFRPGIVKESYNTRGRNLFSHIHPQQVTAALLS
jgi:hypothetical protein